MPEQKQLTSSQILCFFLVTFTTVRLWIILLVFVKCPLLIVNPELLWKAMVMMGVVERMARRGERYICVLGLGANAVKMLMASGVRDMDLTCSLFISRLRDRDIPRVLLYDRQGRQPE